jgi:hypothetical protein
MPCPFATCVPLSGRSRKYLAGTFVVCCLALFEGGWAQPAGGPAALYLYYPRARSTVALNVFFNRKWVAHLRYGQRLVYQTTYRGSLMVTVTEEATHRETRALAKNTRTVDVQPGREYYFEVDGKGIEYVPAPATGKAHFDQESDFLGRPVVISTPAADSIPGLQPRP